MCTNDAIAEHYIRQITKRYALQHVADWPGINIVSNDVMVTSYPVVVVLVLAVLKALHAQAAGGVSLALPGDIVTCIATLRETDTAVQYRPRQ